MTELIAKLEALKGRMSFYDNGIDDCVKVVKDYLETHPTEEKLSDAKDKED